jgi:uncharacterized membrane protein YuzA (DUF378 family)
MLKKALMRLLLTILSAFIGMLGGFGFLVVTNLRGDSETMLTPIVWGFWLGGAFGLLVPGTLFRGTTRPADGEAASALDAGQRNATCQPRETTGLRDL